MRPLRPLVALLIAFYILVAADLPAMAAVRQGTSTSTATTSTFSQSVTLVNAPTVTTVSPNRGTARGGVSILIFGLNLKYTTSVTIGGVATKFQIYGDALYALSPPNTTGLKDVVVASSYGSATLPQAFEYIAPVKFQSGQLSMEGLKFYVPPAPSATINTGTAYLRPLTAGGTLTGDITIAPPTISSINPARGIARGGTSFLISGTRLTDATSVTIGGVSAKFQIFANELYVLSPPNYPGRKDVVVVTPNGTATLPQAFECIAPLKFQSDQVSMEGLKNR